MSLTRKNLGLNKPITAEQRNITVPEVDEWADPAASGTERHSERFPTLPTPVEVSDLESMKIGDPGLHREIMNVLYAIENDLVPPDVQMMLVEAMSPAVRREVVARISGLEASVLMTFKDQIRLVDTVLRRVVSKDGTLAPGAADMQVSVKEAMNMSLKLTTTMVRDLPKIYSIERVQRLEKSLFMIVEKHLTRDQQNLVLEELERQNLEAS